MIVWTKPFVFASRRSAHSLVVFTGGFVTSAGMAVPFGFHSCEKIFPCDRFRSDLNSLGDQSMRFLGIVIFVAVFGCVPGVKTRQVVMI